MWEVVGWDGVFVIAFSCLNKFQVNSKVFNLVLNLACLSTSCSVFLYSLFETLSNFTIHRLNSSILNFLQFKSNNQNYFPGY